VPERGRQMAKMKELYFDGKLVGEYLATDDRQQELESAKNLLREKGLYNPPTLEQAIFRQAVSFATTASYLYKRDLTTKPTNGLSIAPFVVNAAFALELYLKALGHLFNKQMRGHDLLKLFDALPSEAHQALHEHFKNAKWECDITDMIGFRKALQDLRGAFVDWRYLHERVSPRAEIHFASMIFVMEVLHETCRAHEKIRGIPAAPPGA